MGIVAKEIKITFSKIQSLENIQIIASLRGFLGGGSMVKTMAASAGDGKFNP